MSISKPTPVVISSSPKLSSQGNNITLVGQNFIPINNTNILLEVINIIYLVSQTNPSDEIEMYAFPRDNNNLEFGFNDRPTPYVPRIQTNFNIQNIKEGSKYNIIVKYVILQMPPEVSKIFFTNIKLFIEQYTSSESSRSQPNPNATYTFDKIYPYPIVTSSTPKKYSESNFIDIYGSNFDLDASSPYEMSIIFTDSNRNSTNMVIINEIYFSIVNDKHIVFDIGKYVSDRENSNISTQVIIKGINNGNSIGFVTNVEYLISVMNSQFEQISQPTNTATFLFDK